MNSIQEISNKSFVETGRIDYVLYDLVDTSFGDLITSLFGTFHYYPWIFSLIGSMLVGLSGIFPLLVIPLEGGEALKFGSEYVLYSNTMCRCLTVICLLEFFKCIIFKYFAFNIFVLIFFL